MENIAIARPRRDANANELNRLAHLAPLYQLE